VAGSKSDYLEKVILDLVFGAVGYTPPGTLYVALSTAIYSDAAIGSEVSSAGTNYGRAPVSNNATQWPAASGTSPATKTNANAITFATCSGIAWGNVKSFYVMDALTGGNTLYGGDLALAKDIGIGDTATFAGSPNGLTITED
jgi:hypothetical protein